MTETFCVNDIYASADAKIRDDWGQATRFLQRATFGPKKGDVEHLQSIGVDRWFDEQQDADLGLGFFDTILDPDQRFGFVLADKMMTNGAQLRQRVAFAISQIIVVSEDGATSRQVAGFADILHAHALGDFRELLEGVTLSPAMGDYLSYTGNMRTNDALGTVPDENYAREVMQLFTIGLWELTADGERRLVDGEPVPTYEQEDVVGLARVFTGWQKPLGVVEPERFRAPLAVWEPTERYHEHGEKRFLDIVIPPGTGAVESLRIALDALCNHPNVAPFIGKQLIQRLVTSNPTPAYVNRVADIWNDDGEGKRGNLAAVVRAVLLDPEALSADPPETFGKLREPVLRWTAVARMLDATCPGGKWALATLSDPSRGLGQQPYKAPSVFNFYRPGYVPPGTKLADRGLVSPEMQLVHASSAVGWVNWLSRTLLHPPGEIQFDFDDFLPLVEQPDKLADELERRLCPGRMTSRTRGAIVRSLPTVRKSDPSFQARLKVMSAVILLVASTDFLYDR